MKVPELYGDRQGHHVPTQGKVCELALLLAIRLDRDEGSTAGAEEQDRVVAEIGLDPTVYSDA